MVRKYTDVQATRDIQRAEELVAHRQGRQPHGDHRALRDHAESSGVSLHAAALAVLSGDPVVPRAVLASAVTSPAATSQAVPRQPDRRGGPRGAARSWHDDDPERLDPLQTERLCVAARSVQARLSDLGAVDETDRSRLAEHTEALSDLGRLAGMSPATVAAHACAVRDTLAAVGSDEALGIAVWFDDVLGSEALVRT